MICVGWACDSCIHQRENIDGWKCACDAFPEGIPKKILFEVDPRNLSECNNEIGYEERPDNILRGI